MADGPRQAAESGLLCIAGKIFKILEARQSFGNFFKEVAIYFQNLQRLFHFEDGKRELFKFCSGEYESGEIVWLRLVERFVVRVPLQLAVHHNETLQGIDVRRATQKLAEGCESGLVSEEDDVLVVHKTALNRQPARNVVVVVVVVIVVTVVVVVIVVVVFVIVVVVVVVPGGLSQVALVDLLRQKSRVLGVRSGGVLGVGR